jgi:spore germination cell wall hydrolase CwlJ-like protein
MIRLKDLLIENKLYMAANEAIDAPPVHIQPSFVKSVTASVNPSNITKAYIAIATLWGEARGEGEQGMQAVMNVIMNRAKGDFNKTDSVILKPKQFSFWNGKSSPEKLAVELVRKHSKEKEIQLAIQIVDKAMKGKLSDITGESQYYFNPKLAKPSWAKKLTKTKTIGNHDFYK